MSWHVIEPRDPLMVRDGRPFGLDTDGARSLDFPPPSAIAGALRTRIWHRRGGWTSAEAKHLPIRGPILAELGEGADVRHTWFPAPRDCVLFDRFDRAPGWERFPLAPIDRWTDGADSLPAGLRPIGPTRVEGLPEQKPAKAAPAFWQQQALQRWLQASPASKDILEPSHARGPLLHERRVHVALDPVTGTGEDGKLFQTDGLRFAEYGCSGAGERRMGLLVECDHPDLQPGLMTLGGERRVSLFARLAGASPVWEAPVVRERARVVLLTPAVFGRGAIPESIEGAKVVAAAVGRAQVMSGWDMALGGPKPTRRMVPAGSVYWVELAGLDPDVWAKKIHLRAISDDVQDRRDGFGLAAVGVWA
jgi:CRISPR-associated protein Cmr3